MPLGYGSIIIATRSWNGIALLLSSSQNSVVTKPLGPRRGNRVLHPFPGAFKLMLWPRRASGQLLPYKWGMG